MATANRAERGYQSKRYRVGSDESEAEIQYQRCDNIVVERIACSGCKLEYCLECANVSKTLFSLIIEGELEDFKWSCRSCKATFPSLENISYVLGDIQKTTDKRITSLEERVTHFERNTSETIKDSIENMKSEVIDSVKENLNKLVDERTREIEDRKRRDNNLVLFNLSEHRSQIGEENKRRDEANFKDLSASLGLDNPQIQLCFRLGKYYPTKNRPLKVVFENRAHRKYLLDNARYISDKASENLKNVTISKDLTLEQRTERRNRRRQRIGQQQGPGQQRGDGIAQMPDRVSPPRMRFAEPVAMNIDQRPPSPIHGNYPHINDHEFMENLQPEYDQSTIIGEDTVIGGLSQGNEPPLTDANTHS